MADLFPEGLTKKEFDLLNRCSNEISDTPLDDLLKQAARHLEKVRCAHIENLFVNFKLARHIYQTFQRLTDEWENIPSHGKPWLKGMIRYFTLSSDLECDFTSPIGFDDDVEIMNACLRLAGREELCIAPEDFDDV
ncbi:hypothetical protein DSCOOX_58150 [Desulfosarcina ovata subsp. ovata]|uniref:DUF1232 domain-containing protein n=1 Tax=Desulfosarcina ovata subsp. ovata TaxID=2752305 RepID=A0A5K8AIW5_9BACT|nr:hypothetical protein DSCOOX_58150 [Desulfosarcina ovata subsp. ovata]